MFNQDWEKEHRCSSSLMQINMFLWREILYYIPEIKLMALMVTFKQVL